MERFERALIFELVRAGLAVARAKGKRVGRPRRAGVDTAKIAALREQGRSRREIARELGVGASTARAVAQRCAENHSPATPVND